MPLAGKWSKSEVEGLTPIKLRALLKSAQNANDLTIAQWCSEVLNQRAARNEKPVGRIRIRERLTSIRSEVLCPPDLLDAVEEGLVIYEGLNGHYPSRTIRMLENRGIVGGLEQMMVRPKSTGAAILLANNQSQWLTEALIIRWSHLFSEKAITKARARLIEWGLNSLAGEESLFSRPKLSFSSFCESLGCPLVNMRWSWCARAPNGRRAVFTFWDDLSSLPRYVLWSPSNGHINDRPGAKEIRQIAEEFFNSRQEALGILCVAKDASAEPRTRQRYDDKTLIKLRLEREDGALVAYPSGTVNVNDVLAVTVQGQSSSEAGRSALDDLDEVPEGAEHPVTLIGGPTAGGPIGFQRIPQVRNYVVRKSGGRCEYCGTVGFTKENGNPYIEAHHIIALSQQGPDTVSNVVALCPGHHKEAHFGKERDALERRLLEIATKPKRWDT